MRQWHFACVLVTLLGALAGGVRAQTTRPTSTRAGLGQLQSALADYETTYECLPQLSEHDLALMLQGQDTNGTNPDHKTFLDPKQFQLTVTADGFADSWNHPIFVAIGRRGFVLRSNGDDGIDNGGGGDDIVRDDMWWPGKLKSASKEVYIAESIRTDKVSGAAPLVRPAQRLLALQMGIYLKGEVQRVWIHQDGTFTERAGQSGKSQFREIQDIAARCKVLGNADFPGVPDGPGYNLRIGEQRIDYGGSESDPRPLSQMTHALMQLLERGTVTAEMLPRRTTK